MVWDFGPQLSLDNVDHGVEAKCQDDGSGDYLLLLSDNKWARTDSFGSVIEHGDHLPSGWLPCGEWESLVVAPQGVLAAWGAQNAPPAINHFGVWAASGFRAGELVAAGRWDRMQEIRAGHDAANSGVRLVRRGSVLVSAPLESGRGREARRAMLDVDAAERYGRKLLRDAEKSRAHYPSELERAVWCEPLLDAGPQKLLVGTTSFDVAGSILAAVGRVVTVVHDWDEWVLPPSLPETTEQREAREWYARISLAPPTLREPRRRDRGEGGFGWGSGKRVHHRDWYELLLDKHDHVLAKAVIAEPPARVVTPEEAVAAKAAAAKAAEAERNRDWSDWLGEPVGVTEEIAHTVNPDDQTDGIIVRLVDGRSAWALFDSDAALVAAGFGSPPDTFPTKAVHG